MTATTAAILRAARDIAANEPELGINHATVRALLEAGADGPMSRRVFDCIDAEKLRIAPHGYLLTVEQTIAAFDAAIEAEERSP